MSYISRKIRKKIIRYIHWHLDGYVVRGSPQIYEINQTVKEVYRVKRMLSIIQSTLKTAHHAKNFQSQYLSPVAFTFVRENEFEHTIHSATVTHSALRSFFSFIDIECCI